MATLGRKITDSGDLQANGGINGPSGAGIRKIFFLFWSSDKYKTLKADQVPDQYRLPYILTGYRQPNSSFLYCIASAFRLNNETLNIWTHFVPILAVLVYSWRTFPSPLWPLSAIEPFYYPLISEEISIITYHICSTVAHTFNCMSPRIRHICFYIDYAAICTYGIGACCSTACYYSWPVQSEHFLFKVQLNYFRGCFLLCIMVMYIMCTSRHKWVKLKYIVRTLACMSMIFYTNSLIFYHLWKYLAGTGGDHTHSVSYVFVGCCAGSLAAILNPCRVPERFYPSTFDTIGYSHQMVHILLTVATLAHLWAIQITITQLQIEDRMIISSKDSETFKSSLEWTFGTFIATLTMVLWFAKKLTPEGHLKE